MGERSTRVLSLDLGDRVAQYCVVSARGGVEREGRVAMTPRGLGELFSRWRRVRVVMEVGTQSPWVSRLAAAAGHEVVVANARQVALIYGNRRKSDRVDARSLARLGRVDVGLLHPVFHRGEAEQAALAVVRSRDAAVRARTLLINQVRGTVKSWGGRLPSCSAASFASRVADQVPAPLAEALCPLVAQIGELSASIRGYDRTLRQQIDRRYPTARALEQVGGVGPVTALTYVLTLGDPSRFARSRRVGAYLGLVPRRDQSGDSEPQLGITKQGDAHLRRLLVQCAHWIVGRHGTDSDLRRYGLRICERGGKNAKKRAVVAVARKLAVLLHRLWLSGELYEPLRGPARAVEAA